MTFLAFALLIASAVLHAIWNLLLKRADDKYVTMFWAMTAGSLCFLPLLFIGKPLTFEILPFALVSALLETVYVIALPAAYRKADFSFVYPISRGAAPALLFVWSFLFLNESISLAGVCGLAIIFGGLLTISCGAHLNQAIGAASSRNLLLALLLALVISLYSLIDAVGVRRAGSLAYIPVVFASTSIFLTPYMLKRCGWQALKAGLKVNPRQTAIIGFLLLSSYGLVLVAFTLVPIGYAGAVRESSIIFGALAGWLFLGENFGVRRLLCSAIIFLGILVIARFG